jgi:uncharacterized protein
MLLDAHAHSCGNFLNADGIISALDKLGIDKVVLCPGMENDDHNQTLPHLAKTFPSIDCMLIVNRLIRLISLVNKPRQTLQQRNEYVSSLQKKHPERIVQFWWVDPTRPDAAQNLVNNYMKAPFKGIKLHQVSANFHCTGKVIHQVVDFARVRRMPVFIHLYTRESVREFAAFSQVHPEVQFIVAHLIGLEWFAETPAEFPNLNFEISPYWMISDRRVLHAVKTFGAQRVLFGSDTPFGEENQQNNIQRVLSLPISLSEKRMILGENMAALLGL